MCVLDRHNDKVHKYELLNVCEFNSTRKRMSVIVRDNTGKITLMCKGADSVIEARLSRKSLESSTLERTQESVKVWAQEGLRTLFLAEKTVDPEFY